MNLSAIFLTGLLTGGLTCLAVQGGLLASSITQQGNNPKSKIISIILFLAFKLIAYAILGFLLGLFGSIFQLSLSTRVIMQIGVGIFMIGSALNMINLHPVFRYFVIQPPKLLFKLLKKQTKSNDFFAPALLGAFTVFIPCGTTQAMMALAIASGNPITGALILSVFILGTSPLFFTLGYLTSKIENIFQDKFLKAAAVVIIILAFININNAFALTGYKISLENPFKGSDCTSKACDINGKKGNAVSEVTINLENNKYNPNFITVKAGTTVTLHLKNNNAYSCIQAFTIPKLGIEKIVAVGTTETVNITVPDEPGELTFMCSMGMYRGIIQVVR